MKLIGLILVLGAQLAQAQPVKMKAYGGNSGGGGDLTVLQPMDQAELTAFIRDEVTELATWYFRIFASPTWDGTPLTPIAEKLFNGPRSIFAAIKAARLQIQNAPCVDPNSGQARDAAADVRTGMVCFSPATILKRTPNRILRSQVLGLAIHEFSHLVGFDEEGARLLGDSAVGSISIDGTSLMNFRDAWGEVTKSIGDVAWLKDLSQRASSLEPAQLAMSAGIGGFSMAKDIEKAYNFISLFTLSPWSLEQRVRAVAVQIKAMNLVSFGCSLPGSYRANAYGCPDFKMFTPNGPAKRTLADLASDDGHPLQFAGNFSIDVRNLTTGDRGALAAELADLVSLAGELATKR